jgi:hypothetical protein
MEGWDRSHTTHWLKSSQLQDREAGRTASGSIRHYWAAVDATTYTYQHPQNTCQPRNHQHLSLRGASRNLWSTRQSWRSLIWATGVSWWRPFHACGKQHWPCHHPIKRASWTPNGQIKDCNDRK